MTIEMIIDASDIDTVVRILSDEKRSEGQRPTVNNGNGDVWRME